MVSSTKSATNGFECRHVAYPLMTNFDEDKGFRSSTNTNVLVGNKTQVLRSFKPLHCSEELHERWQKDAETQCQLCWLKLSPTNDFGSRLCKTAGLICRVKPYVHATK